MKNALLFFCMLTAVLLISSRGMAQGPGQHKNKIFRKIQRTTWIAGLSGMVIDDDAKAFTDLFDVNSTWNFLYFPSRLSLEGYYRKGITFGGSLGYGRITKGTRLDDFNTAKPVHLITFDFGSNFYFREFEDGLKPFSPYLPVSLGYTFRSLAERKSALTANTGIGFAIRIRSGFGIYIQSLAKFALNKASSRNYLQHSVGVVYCFNLLKGARVPASYR